MGAGVAGGAGGCPLLWACRRGAKAARLAFGSQPAEIAAGSGEGGGKEGKAESEEGKLVAGQGQGRDEG